MSDDDEQFPVPINERMIEARADLERAVVRYLDAAAAESGDPDRQGSLPVAWVLGVEWTSVALEQANRYGRDYASPLTQAASASKGLGLAIAERY